MWDLLSHFRRVLFCTFSWQTCPTKVDSLHSRRRAAIYCWASFAIRLSNFENNQNKMKVGDAQRERFGNNSKKRIFCRKYLTFFCYFKEVDGTRSSNGIQYRLQLLYSNGNIFWFSFLIFNKPKTIFDHFHRCETRARHLRKADWLGYQTGN